MQQLIEACTQQGHRCGFEFKCTDAPSMTRSIHVALEDLEPKKIYVIYPESGSRQSTFERLGAKLRYRGACASSCLEPLSFTSL
jgi:hypothetical protein